MGDRQIKVYVSKYSNWNASELMYLYAKNTPGVSHERDKYMQTFLFIEGKKYRCKRWTIMPDFENEDCEAVTIDLEEME